MDRARFEDYPFELRPLTKAEGGGWRISWPDLPGCLSDGETPEEAIEHGKNAFAAWMAVRTQDLKRDMPRPFGAGAQPARFVVRAPRTLHARLVVRAKEEGVSLNTLITTLMAESLGRTQPVEAGK